MASVLSADPGDIELTVYNQGFGLVKEIRQYDLKQGRQLVYVGDVAQMIEASSVGVRSVSAPGSFTILEQNYQYDLISPAAILAKVVGKQIILNRVLPNGVKERVTGTLMSSPTAIISGESGNMHTYNGMVIKTDDGRILLDPSGEVEVASIPNGLISTPTLVWDLQAETSGKNKVELSYLTQGISWIADYVLQLDDVGTKADLKGWVTLTNNSGATYENAKLKLLAGDVQRVQERLPMAARGGAQSKQMDAGFQEEQFADYHLYTLQRPATVKNKEMKQVSLLEGFGVPVKKKLVIDSMIAYPGYRPGEGEVGTGVMKPQIRIEFTNDKASHLGMPLPAGKVKVFGRDKSGSVQMLGEDTIGHTPRDEKISLVVGRAFDVVAERKRTSFQLIRRGNEVRGIIETFEIEIRNRKETPENVNVIERLYGGEWKITAKNMEFTQLDSNTVEFVVALNANEVKKLVYTVESRW